MDMLKLIALDAEDLKIVSAHVQDAVVKADDLDYRAGERRFVMAMNRFAWEVPGGFFRRRNERRRSVLHFDRVLSVRTTGFSQDASEEVLSLLAIRFADGEAPAGAIELTFAGGTAIQLEVECIEARLADLGAAWEARARPAHRV